MRTGRWRCFWRWPLGHRWEYVVVDQRYGYRRCGGCGKTKGSYTGKGPADGYTDYGGFGGD